MLIIGESTRVTIGLLNEHQRNIFYDQVREFFICTTEKLLHYLPFSNATLRSLRFLLPSSKSSSRLEKWVIKIAKEMPSVVSSAELDDLRLEIRIYKSSSPIDDTSSVNDFWKTSLQNIQCPILSKLVRACLILPHGNAEVERLFSMIGDILVKKRQNLDQRSVRALTFIKSDMIAQEKTCYDYCITPKLITYVENAKQAYKQRLQEEKEVNARKAEEERLNRQRSLMKEEREKSTRLSEINNSIQSIDDAVAASEERLKRAHEIEKEAQKMKENALATQRTELEKKKAILAEQQRIEKRIAEKVLKESVWDKFVIPKKKKKV